MNSISQKDLLIGIKNGNEAIIKMLYVNLFPKVQSYILKNSGNDADAEDVFQESLTLIYQKLQDDQLELTCSLDTFVFAISKNLWLKSLRRKGRNISGNNMEINLSDPDDDIVERLISNERNQLYRKYFKVLGDKCKILLSLFFEGKSTEEVMEVTNYTNGYVRKKKFDCKKQLLEAIESDPRYNELVSESKIDKK